MEDSQDFVMYRSLVAYKNTDRKNRVSGYSDRRFDGFIIIAFFKENAVNDKDVFLCRYTHESAGTENLTIIRDTAEAGEGLCKFLDDNEKEGWRILGLDQLVV